MICFTWKGFPQYAARCIGAFVSSTTEKVVVVATRPDVPITGMEEFCKCKVYWVEDDAKIDVKQFLGEIPSCIFSSGWSVPAFNHIAGVVKKSGGAVVLQNDINFRFSFKDILRLLRFRLFIRNRYDAYFVPGDVSAHAMRIYGICSDRIVKGVYAADDGLFTDGGNILNRPKKIVYVGRFCNRKNVIGLCDAFLAAKGPSEGWTLELYGCGEDEHFLPKNHPAIKVGGFLQPEFLAQVYKNARCFALASYDEPWGMVVHEAALSGCVLMLSNRVGAVGDFVSAENGILFDPKSKKSMVSAMRKLFNMDERSLLQAYDSTLSAAAKFSKETFVASVHNILNLVSRNLYP